MRAPSPELLRALRSATLPFAASSSRRTLARRGQCLAGPGPRPLRQLSTSPTLCSPSDNEAHTRTPAATRIRLNTPAPTKHDRAPPSPESTQANFAEMDIFAAAGVEAPATSVDACTPVGFHLNNGISTTGGKGVLLLDGEAFVWTPWNNNSISGQSTPPPTQKDGGGAAPPPAATASGFTPFLDVRRSTLHIPPSTLGLLALLYPKPSLLIIGTGRRLWQLSRESRHHLSEELGMKIDVMDTGNAVATYNLLATERGVEEVGALLVPEGFDVAPTQWMPPRKKK